MKESREGGKKKAHEFTKMFASVSLQELADSIEDQSSGVLPLYIFIYKLFVKLFS